MLAYAIRRLLLIVPTLLGILVVNFVIIQAAPGGPVEQMIAQIKGQAVDPTARFGGSEGAETAAARAAPGPGRSEDPTQKYRGARGLDPEFVRYLERLYGFDRPAPERFLAMLRSYLVFDFGRSYFRDQRVIDLVVQKLPVSISLGLWTTLLVYLVSIPLGVGKAVRDGSAFDVWTSSVVVVGYAIPSFLFGLLLIVLFAGGSYWSWFPLRGLTSEHWETLSWPARVADYFWHLTLPIAALLVGAFATLTLLTKNSFLDEIRKQYVVTARSKGLSRRRVLYGHVFRNAMLLVIAGFPSAFVKVFFASSLLVEVIFSLDGLGLLGFQAALTRDYPIMFATLYIFTLLGLVLNVLSDLTYAAVDPRIDFARREA